MPADEFGDLEGDEDDDEDNDDLDEPAAMPNIVRPFRLPDPSLVHLAVQPAHRSPDL